MKLVKAKEGYIKVGDKYLLAKKCSCCGEWLVASEVNFYKLKYSKDGLENRCKKCKCDYGKKYREENRKIREKRSDDYKAKTKEQRLEFSKMHKEKNDKNRKKRIKQYREQYMQSPQGQVVLFNRNQRRRAKEEQQGTGITKEQWLEMMNFFGWRCAYSGEYLGGDDNSFNRTIDHIVPISTGGDNMIWNCVPMTRSLNSSKWAKDMLEWYKEQDCYSEARLAKIYEWQEYARKKWKK